MNKRYYLFGLLAVLIVFVFVSGVSYLALDYYYGGEEDMVGPGPAPTNGAVGDGAREPTGEETPAQTELPDILPISIWIGIGASAVVAITWEVSRKARGEAASVLIEGGHDNATVRDVELVATMIKKREFTVPEIARNVGVSRSTVWRLVKKMKAGELIRETGEEKLPKTGRGKPSKVYEYVGIE